MAADAAHEWSGYAPETNTADYAPPSGHPQTTDQDYLVSWNNKQAKDYGAADGNFSFGAVHRGDLLEAAQRAWDEAVELGERYGYRNAQATVLAPTGTISFLMDCDTTGIEPDFSLVKFKELVGGGQMTIVNRSVPLALRTLGYSDSEIDQIEAYVNEHATIVDAVLEGDGRRAAELMSEHVADSLQRIRETEIDS